MEPVIKTLQLCLLYFASIFIAYLSFRIWFVGYCLLLIWEFKLQQKFPSKGIQWDVSGIESCVQSSLQSKTHEIYNFSTDA